MTSIVLKIFAVLGMVLGQPGIPHFEDLGDN